MPIPIADVHQSFSHKVVSTPVMQIYTPQLIFNLTFFRSLPIAIVDNGDPLATMVINSWWWWSIGNPMVTMAPVEKLAPLLLLDHQWREFKFVFTLIPFFILILWYFLKPWCSFQHDMLNAADWPETSFTVARVSSSSSYIHTYLPFAINDGWFIFHKQS